MGKQILVKLSEVGVVTRFMHHFVPGNDITLTYIFTAGLFTWD